MLRTRITEMLGIQYPIIQGAMGHLALAELVSAVSNAGGLGMLAARSLPNPSKETLRREIRRTKSMTRKPFGVNISLFAHHVGTTINECMDVVVEEGIRVVETNQRSPEEYVPRLHGAGIKLIHKTVGVRYARTAERAGCDAVSMVGYEGGGHPGMLEVSTLVLIPRVVDSVKIPVLAGGGIADARGFVAALALGAEGVFMGTRFMLTKECALNPKAREALLKALETDTVVLEKSIRNAHRVARTPSAEKVLALEASKAGEQAIASAARDVEKAVVEGDLERGVLPCGQGVGLIDKVETVQEVIDGIIRGATAIWERWDKEGFLKLIPARRA